MTADSRARGAPRNASTATRPRRLRAVRTIGLVRKGPLIAFSLLLSLLVLTGASTAGSGASEATTGWRGDFETGDQSQWKAVQAKAHSRITVQSTVVREGRYAARVEVRRGDNNVAGSGSGERSELFIGSSTTGGFEGQEQYWAWSTYFPPDFDAPVGLWNAFTQFHHSGTTGQVNVQFAVADRKRIELRVLGGSVSAPARRDLVLARLMRGHWYDFVFHVKWSSTRAGFVEVWVNGLRVVKKSSMPTLYSGQAVYLKHGYYRRPYGGTTVVYHDGMRRGSRLSEVADWARAFDPE